MLLEDGGSVNLKSVMRWGPRLEYITVRHHTWDEMRSKMVAHQPLSLSRERRAEHYVYGRKTASKNGGVDG